nr:phage tail assembly protein [Pseudomonas mohnii]
MSIPLKFPFKSAEGVQITSLPLTRLKRKDISAAQSNTKDEAAMEDFLLARMTGMTVEDLMDLDIADSRTVTDVFREMARGGDVAEILGRSAATGTEDAAV